MTSCRKLSGMMHLRDPRRCRYYPVSWSDLDRLIVELVVDLDVSIDWAGEAAQTAGTFPSVFKRHDFSSFSSSFFIEPHVVFCELPFDIVADRVLRRLHPIDSAIRFESVFFSSSGTLLCYDRRLRRPGGCRPIRPPELD